MQQHAGNAFKQKLVLVLQGYSIS